MHHRWVSTYFFSRERVDSAISKAHFAACFKQECGCQKSVRRIERRAYTLWQTWSLRHTLADPCGNNKVCMCDCMTVSNFSNWHWPNSASRSSCDTEATASADTRPAFMNCFASASAADLLLLYGPKKLLPFSPLWHANCCHVDRANLVDDAILRGVSPYSLQIPPQPLDTVVHQLQLPLWCRAPDHYKSAAPFKTRALNLELDVLYPCRTVMSYKM